MGSGFETTIKRGAVYQACVKLLDSYDIPHSIENRSKHAYLVFIFRGQTFRKLLSHSGNSSDKNSSKIAIAEIRRMLRTAEKQSAIPPISEPAVRPENNGSQANRLPVPIASIHVVRFHGAALETFERDGERYAALKPIVEGIGLDWSSQLKRVSRDAVLSTVAVTMTMTGADGRRYDMSCLPLKFLNGFLFGVDSARVKEGIRTKVIEYQLECHDALARYWMKGVAINPRAETEVMIEGLSPDAALAIGGIVKAVVIKQTGDLRAGMDLLQDELGRLVQHFVANGPMTAIAPPSPPDMVTAFEVVSRMAEVPENRRYGGLAGQVSARLSRFCARKGFQVGLIDLRPGEKLTFPRQAALEWLAAGGRADIWHLANGHAARSGGQTVLALAPAQ